VIAAFGVSNIAWPHESLDGALELSRELGVSSIEIAPFNVFGRWTDVADDAARLRDAIERRGLVCDALQGIVYNVPGVELFASDDSRARLAAHLRGVARLAGALGAKACVYGAPKQRDPGDLAPEAAREVAVEFFRGVGPAFAAEGAALAFEANAREYGCRFVTTTAEAIDLVTAIDAPGVGLQIDTGTIFLEREDPDVLLAAAPLAVHAHVSEPALKPTGESGVDHRPIAAALRKSGYGRSLSIEMRAVDDWRGALRRAAELVRTTYVD
jgi:sugar phosphate isomerase/epimerase